MLFDIVGLFGDIERSALGHIDDTQIGVLVIPKSVRIDNPAHTGRVFDNFTPAGDDALGIADVGARAVGQLGKYGILRLRIVRRRALVIFDWRLNFLMARIAYRLGVVYHFDNLVGAHFLQKLVAVFD